MSKVKIIKPSTCQAIFEVTRDQNHFHKCPIIMEKSVWLSIRPSVMMKKQSRGNLGGIMDDLFWQMFGGKK